MLQKRVWIFHVDKSANIAWYQGAALVFTSATGHNISSLREGIKEMFEKHRQEAKHKAFMQHQRHTRKYDEGFEMCDKGFNSLGSPNIFHGLRYREWMHEVWESYKFYV